MASTSKISHLDFFNTVKYDFSGKNDYINIKNITQYIDIIGSDANELVNYVYYEMLDGERPDQISQKLYETPEYYWILFLLNDHLKYGLNGWPMTNDQMEKYFQKEYDPYFWLSATSAKSYSENSYYNTLSQELYDIPLDEKYLPHLRVTYEESINNIVSYSVTSLKIKHYDHDRLGLVVHKPTGLQHITATLELINDAIPDDILLREEIIELSDGIGGGQYDKNNLDSEWYNNITFTQATGKSKPYLSVIGNESFDKTVNLKITAGSSYAGILGNNLRIILKENTTLNLNSYFYKPIVYIEDNKTNIVFEYSKNTTLNDFISYLNNLSYDNNYISEMSVFNGIEGSDDVSIKMFAITHDESELGWEWQKKCYDLGLNGYNVQAGPWVEPELLDKDINCQPIYKTYAPDSAQRSSFRFNCNIFFSFDKLRNASHSYNKTISWNADENTIINETEIDDFYNVIKTQELLPDGEQGSDAYNFKRSALTNRLTFVQYELNKNLEKKKIKVPRPELVKAISERYHSLLSL